MSDVAELALNPQIAAKIKNIFDDLIPFNKYLGFELENLARGTATIAVRHRREFIGDTMKKILHGGVLCTLIDAAGGAAAVSVLAFPKELTVNTVDLRVDFLRPATGETFYGISNVVRKGSRIVFVDVRVENDTGDLVCRGVGNYSIYAPTPNSDASDTTKQAIIDLADEKG